MGVCSLWVGGARAAPADRLQSTTPASAGASITAPDSWYSGFALPAIDGRVNAILPWGGGVVIGGRFNQVDGIRAANVAFWDGRNWHPLAGGIDGSAFCLGVFEGNLIAAGTFGRAGDAIANNIARWDGASWSPLGDGLSLQYGYAQVHALTVYQGALVAGGFFDHAGDLETRYVARWDGTAWSAIGERSSLVISLAVFDGRLFAGSRRAPGESGALSVLEDSSWMPLDGPTAGRRYVMTLMPREGRLIVAGDFDSLGTMALRNIAVWDGAGWDSLGSGLGGTVRALALYKDTLVAAGGEGVESAVLGLWDGSAWRDRRRGVGGVSALAVTAEGLWAAGSFQLADRNGLHAVDLVLDRGNGWESVGTWNDSMHGLLGTGYGNVRCLAPYRGSIVTGGDWWYAGEPPGWKRLNSVAWWNGESWTDLPSLSPTADVRALLSWRDTLVAGGAFLNGSNVVTNIPVARLDGDHWTSLDTLGLRVECLARYRGRLYASGRSIHGLQSAVYRWGGAGWTSVGEVQEAFPWGNVSVNAMLVHDDRLVIAGEFGGVGGVAAPELAAWDGVTWSPLATPPASGRVTALAVHDGRIIVGGIFPGASVVACEGALAVPLGSYIGEVGSLESMGGRLFAGTRSFDNIYEWDGSAWLPLDGGVNGEVDVLMALDGHLYVGGDFTVAGERSSFGIARWDGLARGPDIPAAVKFESGVPSPFRNSVRLAYRLEAAGRVRIAVLDLSGREIAVLADDWRPVGIHSAEWDGHDAHGRDVRAGVYFVRARIAGGRDRVWRVVRVR